ncbi:MAG: hypothetical protein V3U72_01310 [Candidatus Aenigmarchaeota archaeon]
MSSPIGMILEMISIVIRNTINTLVSVLGVLGEFLASLGFASRFGPLPFLIAVFLLVGVLFFLGKFFISSLKTIVILFIAGFVILGIIFMLA